MYISGPTLDDLMYELLGKLTVLPFDISATRGATSEIIGSLFHLSNPRARLSRTETKGMPFSALGELLWYLSGSNELDFIAYYIPEYKDDAEDGKTIYGAYGPRLYALRGQHNQIETIIDLLRKKPSTRRAVIQLFDAEDILEKRKEIPCTCTLQFFVRNDKLDMFTSMRSNDAFLGFPHDIFSFTMLQEIIARRIGVEIGFYSHAVGSTHLYSDRLDKAKQYLNEGIQSTKSSMPPMPRENLEESIKILLAAEKKIRLNEDFNLSDYDLDPYWADLIRMLHIQALYKKSELDEIKKIKDQMNSPIYNIYIDKKISLVENK